MSSKGIDAGYVAGIPGEDLTSTMTMQRGGSEGSYATDATKDLDSWEMILQVLKRHSPTCAVQKLRLTSHGEIVTITKPGDGNWQHVEDAQRRYQAAGIRHDLALSRGETRDPETSEHHLAHAACCILFRLELALREESDGPT
nr:dATP/dGTP diphosphohydrolase domain-containing protein [Halomonas coralii]